MHFRGHRPSARRARSGSLGSPRPVASAAYSQIASESQILIAARRSATERAATATGGDLRLIAGRVEMDDSFVELEARFAQE